MRNRYLQAATAAIMVFTLAGCAQWRDMTSGTPPATKDVADALERQAAGNRVFQKVDTVDKNVVFADTLIGLYDTRSAALRDDDYISTLPLYAAGIAAGILALHGGNKNTMLDIGLGAGAYYAATSSLDMAGRAEVLQAATQNWQCFGDAAARVRFLDPKTPPGGGTAPELGGVIKHDYENLRRAIVTSRAYLANGVAVDDRTRAALVTALKAAVKIEPAAAETAATATQADRVLAKYRTAILRRVAIEYSGKRHPFAYNVAMPGGDAGGQSISVRTSIGQSWDAQADQDAQSADISTEGSKVSLEDYDAVLTDAKAAPSAKARALIYRLSEMASRFSRDPEYLAVASLPANLEKCLP